MSSPVTSHYYRTFDERGIPIVWRLKVPLYGEADAGAIFYRTLRKQLINQSFIPSEMDSCYFRKTFENSSTMDITAHVDDLLITDDDADLADAEIAKLNEALPLTQCLEPKYFLGSNLHIHSKANMSMTSQAYVRQLVDTLPNEAARRLPQVFYAGYQGPYSRL